MLAAILLLGLGLRLGGLDEERLVGVVLWSGAGWCLWSILRRLSRSLVAPAVGTSLFVACRWAWRPVAPSNQTP